ncbi:MAG: hypothetical protein E7500_02810 [Ruminococcus sp.]|nr:hypothetical protein [Ruminococcus sp.]
MENHNTDTTEENEEIKNQYITKSLLELGLKPNLKGFNYIKYAIDIYPETISTNKRFNYLYTLIAEKYGVSASSVERAIRTSVESAWYGNIPDNSHDIFSFPYITAEKAPTNTMFIATMAELVKFGRFNKK